MSFLFSLQRIISDIPARLAASIFSLIPPTGNTFPRSVISPVIARLGRTLRCVYNDDSDVTIVIPADGPSLGIAPSGTWICVLYGSKSSPRKEFHHQRLSRRDL